MKKRFKLHVLYKVLVVAAIVLFGTEQVNSAKVNATSRGFKYAGKKSDGKPHFILYGEEGKLDGAQIKVTEVLVDVFNDNCTKIEQVRDAKGVQLYDIDEAYNNVINFWRDKPMTNCLISTKKANFDQTSSIVRGDESVKFRSKAMDVDGVGFDADYQNRTIHIRSEVEVVIRVNLFRGDETAGLMGNVDSKKEGKRK